MKKLLFVIIAILLVCSTASAATWTNPDVTSPYTVGVIPVRETANLFGQKSYQQYFGAAAAVRGWRTPIPARTPTRKAITRITVRGRTGA